MKKMKGRIKIKNEKEQKEMKEREESSGIKWY